MNFIYMVRHKTLFPSSGEEHSIQIREWAFHSMAGAELHSIRFIQDFLTGEDRLTNDDPRVLLIQDFQNQLKLSSEDFRSFSIPCNWTRDGERLEDDVLEIEKMIVRR